MRIEPLQGRKLSVDVKRFCVPAVIHDECPKCGEPKRLDLYRDHYLSYPPIGKPFTESLYCGECDHEWDVSLQLEVTLKAAEQVSSQATNDKTKETK